MWTKQKKVKFIGGVMRNVHTKVLKDVELTVERIGSVHWWTVTRPARGTEVEGLFLEGPAVSIEAGKLAAMKALKDAGWC